MLRMLKATSLFGFAAVLLLFSTKPAKANILTSAQGSISCSSVTVSFSAADLAAGDTYTIRYSIWLNPVGGGPAIGFPSNAAYGTIPFFSGDGAGNYSGSFTLPATLSGDYNASGYIALY